MSKSYANRLRRTDNLKVELSPVVASSSSMFPLYKIYDLDTGASEEFYNLISELNREGITVIVISHDIPGVIQYANKVLHLGEQKPIFFGSASEYTQKFLRNKGEEK